MLGGLHSQSGHNEEEKNLLTLLGIKLQFLSHPVYCTISVTAELSQLQLQVPSFLWCFQDAPFHHLCLLYKVTVLTRLI